MVLDVVGQVHPQVLLELDTEPPVHHQGVPGDEGGLFATAGDLSARTVPRITVLSPMNPATNRFAGASYMRSAASTCWMAPGTGSSRSSRRLSSSC